MPLDFTTASRVAVCPGKRLESGLLADPCHNCQRKGEGSAMPAAEFIDTENLAGWRCVQQLIKDRPQAR